MESIMPPSWNGKLAKSIIIFGAIDIGITWNTCHFEAIESVPDINSGAFVPIKFLMIVRPEQQQKIALIMQIK